MCQDTTKRADTVRMTEKVSLSKVAAAEADARIAAREAKKSGAKAKAIKHSLEREWYMDYLAFFAPLLLCRVTNVWPVFITGFGRIIATRAFMSLHYIFIDKDNYKMKLNQRQLRREKGDYTIGAVLHMWIQVVLQIIFPSMFFAPEDQIVECAKNTFISHVLLVEPLYYAVHLWLHVPNIMRLMHSFHHMSVKTLPSTSLVQDFKEHFIYVATFGPAFFAPFLLTGQNHWTVICAYLILFDIVNAFGHTNISLNGWLFNSKYSPMRYLFYTPEFHLGHHKYYRANYGLFMPVWDFLFGTYKEYKIPSPEKLGVLPENQQDFVFVGHCGGLGHLLTCPEWSVYNVYDRYTQFLPFELEFLIVDLAGFLCRLFISSYKVSRYCIDKKLIGRIICVVRTPMDYFKKSRFSSVNKDIVDLIEREYKLSGTRYFGLGNMNKNKQLNDGGNEIVRLVQNHKFLKDKKIRVWTGDTLTAASVYHQIIDIPNLKEIFFVGGNGKIGQAVIELLIRKGIKVTIYSRYEAISNPVVSYSTDLHDMAKFEHVVIGKLLHPKIYRKAVKIIQQNKSEFRTRFLLDYTVPFMPMNLGKNVQHIQIAVLNVGSKSCSSDPLLEGHFDVCMGHDQNEIYPCHAGCILNSLEKRETNETGDIDADEVIRMWKIATKMGLRNRTPPVAEWVKN